VAPRAMPWVAGLPWVTPLDTPWVAGMTWVAGVSSAVLRGAMVLEWFGNTHMGPPPNTLNIYLAYFVGFVKGKV